MTSLAGPRRGTTLQQKRETYRRLWLICEVYKPEWKAALERARQQTGLDNPKKERKLHPECCPEPAEGRSRRGRPQRPPVALPLGLMATWREQGLPPAEIAARVKQINEARINA